MKVLSIKNIYQALEVLLGSLIRKIHHRAFGWASPVHLTKLLFPVRSYTNRGRRLLERVDIIHSEA